MMLGLWMFAFGAEMGCSLHLLACVIVRMTKP